MSLMSNNHIDICLVKVVNFKDSSIIGSMKTFLISVMWSVDGAKPGGSQLQKKVEGPIASLSHEYSVPKYLCLFPAIVELIKFITSLLNSTLFANSLAPFLTFFFILWISLSPSQETNDPLILI